MKQLLQLQVFDGDRLLSQQSFDQSKIVMGRILSADFRIPDTRISRIHALLERTDEGAFRLTDLASSHGTTVNGQKIIERLVGPADQIELAGLKLQITLTRVEEPVSEDSVIMERTERVQSPETRVNTQRAMESVEPVDTGGSRPRVREGRDPTAIRSLKETARSRGAIDSVSSIHQELELTVYWEETILNIEHLRGGNRLIKIGEAETNDYIVPSHVLPPVFDFIRVQGGAAEIHFHPSMSGSVRMNGEMHTLESLLKNGRSTVSLQGSDIAKVKVGNVNFFLMFVSTPSAIARDEIFDQGPLFWFLFLFVGVFVGGLLFLASQFQAPIEGRVREFPERVRKIIVQQYKKQVAPPVVGVTKSVGQQVENATKTAPKAQQVKSDPGEGSKAAGTEGQAGTKTATKTAGVKNVVTKTPTNKRPKPQRLPIKEQPKSLLETLKASGLGSKIAKAGESTSLDTAFEGVGANTGSSQGQGGAGLQGAGRGGGNKVEGVGGLGSQGFGPGKQGTGSGVNLSKGEANVATESMNVIVLGGLSREEIERVVNSHQSEIRLCYERQIQKEPGLQGKLDVFWQVGAQGRVMNLKINGNSTGSKALADCVVARIRTWKFPNPPHAQSLTDVTWPWTMKPPGR